MDWLGIISAVASVATAAGVFIAGWQIRLAKRQAKTQFEDDLTKQYREIIKDIPTDALLGLEITTEELEKSRHAFYRYIDISNEEIFLRQQGRVSRETWWLWRDGIKSHLSKPAFRKAWEDIKVKATDNFLELRQVEDHEYDIDPYRLKGSGSRRLASKR
jgi:hypothetical protein